MPQPTAINFWKTNRRLQEESRILREAFNFGSIKKTNCDGDGSGGTLGHQSRRQGYSRDISAEPSNRWDRREATYRSSQQTLEL